MFRLQKFSPEAFAQFLAGIEIVEKKAGIEIVEKNIVCFHFSDGSEIWKFLNDFRFYQFSCCGFRVLRLKGVAA